MPIDHVPPSSAESEAAVLGSILIDADALLEVSDILRPEDFYRPANGTIYASMLALAERREPVDLVTVAARLAADETIDAVGGRTYLSSLANATPTAVHAADYARTVEQKSLMRQLIGAAGKIAAIGYQAPDDAADAIDQAQAALFGVALRQRTAGFEPLGPALQDAYDRLDYLHQNRGELLGVASGFEDLDRLTYGFQPGDLILLAARPSVGKSSMMLGIAENAAVRDRRTVGIFSLEMSKDQLVKRLISSVCRIDASRLATGYMQEGDFGRIAAGLGRLSDAPIFIDESPTLTMTAMRTKARRLSAESGLDLVVVDYLQLIEAGTKRKEANRVQEVSEISRGLKALARELGVPVLALSQMSRRIEQGDSREPRLSDLRDSGTLEQDADMVIFLWREAGSEGTDRDLLNVRLAKNRNGPTGDLRLWFHRAITRFESLYEEGAAT